MEERGNGQQLETGGRRRRNILIFSDGTGQAGGVYFDERRSNIYKLYRATRVCPDSRIDPAEQVAYYDAGLGSRPPGGGTFATIYRVAQNLFSQATGFGLSTNIVDCYEMIIRLWRPGDRIFLFGFSRGAYTVRCLGGVLALCGIPTRIGPRRRMRYDSTSARTMAYEAVRKVYQHTASRPLSTATPRERELLEQRQELARQFRERHAAGHADKSHYPYFIGVFDTVASVASPAAMAVLLLAGAILAVALGSAVSWLADMNWWSSAGWAALGLSGLALAFYLREAVRFAPSADRRRWWRTFTASFRRLRFEDRTLNDNVRYARHAISIDENRKSFGRVEWGDPDSSRPQTDERGVETFQQYWFAGNHSDIGGSYPENEARLSDISLKWMLDAATMIRDGIQVDASVLHLHPSAGGMQHDERKGGFPILTRWLKITWKRRLRDVPPDATLHESVRERMSLPAVLQYDLEAAYRPKNLRRHRQLASLYGTFGSGAPAGEVSAAK
jgi:uncharacterized protein (DUF2235 family)